MKKNILLAFATLVLMAGCKSKPKLQKVEKPAMTKEQMTDKMVANSRKIDSLKKSRQTDFNNNTFSIKKATAVSDTIIKLELENDSLANVVRMKQ